MILVVRRLKQVQSLMIALISYTNSIYLSLIQLLLMSLFTII
jgi:hypothetical protein